jgi:Rrf2 family nitric oxide-sensitive transcriptional repressor
MQLTTFTDYGLRVLMYLSAHPEELSSVKQIAEHYNISRNHLVKVVHRLSLLGYIETTKGKGGGIQITAGADGLRLGDVVIELESSMFMVECFNVQTNSCTITEDCKLKHCLHDATQAFVAVLNEYTLRDVVKNREWLFAHSD